ncbi:hypothetical protein [Streptomyces botrytidirepellens]|nr:hypothetical protein [Streptomyces botrytidirepellens]
MPDHRTTPGSEENAVVTNDGEQVLNHGHPADLKAHLAFPVRW